MTRPVLSSVFLFLIVALSKRRAADAAASADEVVYVTSSYGQLVSSSTLRWRNKDAKTPREEEEGEGDGVVLRQGSSELCRGWHQNQLSPGQTDKAGRCEVGFHGRTYKLNQYQVMVDPTSTSRLEWQKWDIFTKLPLGLVAFTGEDGYVARRKEGPSTPEYRFGDLNPRRGLSGDIAIYETGGDGGRKAAVRYETDGEILVEVQPVRYDLRDVEFLTRRARERREEVHLGSRVLSNELSSVDYERDNSESDSWGSVRSVLAYNASYRYYWGRMPGLAKALPSTGPTFRDLDKRVSFRWALPLEFSLHRILELSAFLRAGTSVQASVSAARVTTEVPYEATLVAVFPDGRRKERPIEGTYVETLLSDVSTVYGRPYFTRNGTFAPTTTTTTTPRPYYVGGARFKAPRTMNPLWPGGTESPAATTASPSAPISRRTTSPLPTTVNPLKRFYPQFGEGSSDGASSGPQMQSDQAKNAKRSPQTESLVNGGASSLPCVSVCAIVTASTVSSAFRWHR